MNTLLQIIALVLLIAFCLFITAGIWIMGVVHLFQLLGWA